MRFVLFLGIIGYVFTEGVEVGHHQLTRALEGCETVASQVAHDVTVAENKAAMCDNLLNNLGSLGDDETSGESP